MLPSLVVLGVPAVKYCTPYLAFFFTQEAYEEHWTETHAANWEEDDDGIADAYARYWSRLRGL